MKIGIIGLGMVGKEVLLNLYRSSIAESIYVLDRDHDKVLGEIMDSEDTIPLTESSFMTRIFYVSDYSALKHCDIVVINVSVPKKMPNRLDLFQDNAAIMREIAQNFVDSHACFIITSNPVDLMSDVFQQYSQVEPKRVIGTGTLLDTARLKIYLSQHFSIAPQNIQTLVLGEHGESAMAAWSLTHIMGLEIDSFCEQFSIPLVDKLKAIDFVHQRGVQIAEKKGYTDHGIGASVLKIIRIIRGNTKEIIPVSTLATGEYGIHKTYLSLPCLMGQKGIERVFEYPLSDTEEAQMRHSAQVLKQVYHNLPPQ